MGAFAAIGRLGRVVFVIVAAPVTLVVASPFILLAAIGVLLLGSCAVIQFVPISSAEVPVPEIEATVKLESFFVLDDETRHSGQYLTVSTRRGVVSKELSWSSQRRTNIYLVGTDIAVLAPDDEYLVQTSAAKFTNLPRGIPSDSWQYLGAFDGKRHLAFFPPAELRECIPDNRKQPTSARSEYREPRCVPPD
jgi:hypothetical protein